ncbi:MAG: hypothetical protein EOP04_16585, partial [Proteobacteria bacterium]
ENNIPLQIVATLIADNKISASEGLLVLKDKELFARCTKANVIFPILAKVYKLPDGSTLLPTDWESLTRVTTVCMENYNVPITPFTLGFPDVPGLTENFGMTTSTTIIIPTTGEYEFQLISDDGSKLWIDDMHVDKAVINNDGAHDAEKVEFHRTKKVTLSAGIHPLKIDYFQGPRFSIALMLFWKKPGETNFTIVPRTAFD